MLGRSSYRAFAIPAMLLMFMIPAGAASAATRVYVAGSTGNIGVASLSGGADQAGFITGGNDTCGNIAVSRKYIYWTNDGDNSIGRATLTGHDVEQHFITGAADPCGIAIYAGHLYWANTYYSHYLSGPNSIGRATIAGKSINEKFIPGADPVNGIAAFADHLYWMGDAGIARANVNGTGLNPSFVPQSTLGGIPEGVAVNSHYIYWTALQAGTIGRANINGTDPDFDWLPDAGGAVAATSQYVYWGTGDTIGRVDLNGTHANTSFITGATDTAGLGIGPPTTTTELSRPAGRSRIGKYVIYTASVSPAPDGGTVRFTDNGKTIHGCGAVKVSLTTGVASCRVKYGSSGKHSIRASYAGDSDFYGSASSAVKETVKR